MKPSRSSPTPAAPSASRRLAVWYGVLILIMVIFVGRLFYLQIVRHDYYRKAALSDQLKQYTIAPTRGIIEAQDNGGNVPIVLNQQLYTLYADPTLVKNPESDAAKLIKITKGDATSYSKLMKTAGTRYVVLAKQLSQSQSDQITALKLPGVGSQGQDYRTYPQGSLASQLLGFVNNNGQGQYGLEQDLNKQLSGTPGTLKAITDASGVPLAASKDNVSIAPKNGDNVLLTVNLSMQAQMEKILQQEYKATKSQGLSAIIMDPNTGQIKAMANYPSYDPSNYQDVSNQSLFQNAAVDNAIEPGSSMKVLTTAAALNQGVIQADETFYDPAHWVVDGFNITDIEQDGGPREQSISSILSLSLNTGATWMLMQMSKPGGTQITQTGVNAWHDYMVDHYRLGKDTGIEQGYEATGYVPTDNASDPAVELTYANSSFGQGVSLTALQEGAAVSSVINGGTYYQPTLISQVTSPDGTVTTNKPKVLERNVVAPKVSQEMIPLLENVVTTYLHEGYSFMSFNPNYLVGGKTGTAQVAQPGGGYYSNIYNGTYVGLVGGDKPQYVIVVFNIKPDVPGYAGALGGQPVFADLAHMLINGGYVTPKSGS